MSLDSLHFEKLDICLWSRYKDFDSKGITTQKTGYGISTGVQAPYRFICLQMFADTTNVKLSATRQLSNRLHKLLSIQDGEFLVSAALDQVMSHLQKDIKEEPSSGHGMALPVISRAIVSIEDN